MKAMDNDQKYPLIRNEVETLQGVFTKRELPEDRPLTPEQLEAEGWKLDFSCYVSTGVMYGKPNSRISLWMISDNTIWIREGENDFTRYRGKCHTLADFKFLCKLLEI
jgi:hypothetical protein